MKSYNHKRILHPFLIMTSQYDRLLSKHPADRNATFKLSFSNSCSMYVYFCMYSFFQNTFYLIFDLFDLYLSSFFITGSRCFKCTLTRWNVNLVNVFIFAYKVNEICTQWQSTQRGKMLSTIRTWYNQLILMSIWNVIMHQTA